MVFGTTILGSNPSAPAKIMKKFIENLTSTINKYFFPFYKNKDIKLLFKNLEYGKSNDKEVAMFVGGCVRNFLQSKKIGDIDVATITVEDLEIKKKIKYKLVGKDEADINFNLIYFKSPIGKALIGKDCNDMVSVETPSGERNFEILKVEYI